MLVLQVELIYIAVGQAELNQVKGQARRSRRDASAAELQTSLHRRQSAGVGGADSQWYSVAISRAYSMQPTSMHELSLFVLMENSALRPRLLLGGLRTVAEWLAAGARYGLYSFRENLVGCFYALTVNVVVLSGRRVRQLFEQYNRNALFLDFCPPGTLVL